MQFNVAWESSYWIMLLSALLFERCFCSLDTKSRTKKKEIVALVDWFWRQAEIPKYILKKIQPHPCEVFKDLSNIPGEIDPETILGKCQVNS